MTCAQFYGTRRTAALLLDRVGASLSAQEARPMNAEAKPTYLCPTEGCGWIGTEGQMQADYAWAEDGDEIWSNWICPKCQHWHRLSDYSVVEPPCDPPPVPSGGNPFYNPRYFRP